VYHHLTMLFFGWYGTKYVAGGQCKQRFLFNQNETKNESLL